MSARIRGKEVQAKITIDGQVASGSWTKLTNFTESPDNEIKKKSYLGEKRHDLDYIHKGENISFEIDLQDGSPLEFMQTIADNDSKGLPYPRVTITVLLAFREAGVDYKAKIYRDVFLKEDELGASGQDEYVMLKISGSCKQVSLIRA